MNMGRPRQFDIDRALDAAMLQFWRGGYEATSLQDLLSAMGLSKSSLYQAFESKHSLFLRCIARYEQLTVSALNDQLNKSPSGKDFIRSFLLSAVAETQQDYGKKGCLLVNTANELAQRDRMIAAAVGKGATNLTRVFARAIDIGKKDGSITSSRDTQVLANYFMTTICGLRTLVKGGAEEQSLQAVVNCALTILE